MIYLRSHEIERRLEAVLCLVHMCRNSTPTLAEQVGVSIPSVSCRAIAQREQGHGIKSERHADGWRNALSWKAIMVKSAVESQFARVGR